MPSSDCLDCELYVSDFNRADLTVAKGVKSGRPILDEALQKRLRQVAPLDPVKYGTELFDAVMPLGSDLQEGYRAGLAMARNQNKRLRFRLRIAANSPPHLHVLKWELLYDAKEKVALCCSRETPFSRCESVGHEPGTPVKTRPKLLVVVSVPKNLAEYPNLAGLNREEIKRSIQDAMESDDVRPKPSDLMTYEFLEGPATATRIRDRLLEGRFHALHIQAHGVLLSGQSKASLVLENEDGNVDFVEENRFSQIFEGERGLRLITLIACHGGVPTGDDPFTGLGPSLVGRGIPAIVAMGQAVSFKAATQFIKYFYGNLARSGEVDAAVNEARNQMSLTSPDSPDWGTPMLFMRLEDGRLWENPKREELTIRREQLPYATQDQVWESIWTDIEADEVVPFLGPGLIQGVLPSSAEIARRWAVKYGYPFGGDGGDELPRVAQFVETKNGYGYPHKLLRRILTDELLQGAKVSRPGPHVIDSLVQEYFDKQEDEPHRILAELPLSTYVTTNYDSLMAAALKWRHKSPRREYCLWRKNLMEHTVEAEKEYCNHCKGSVEEPLVLHLYGNETQLKSLVLTEDDYLDFLRAIAHEDWRIPQHVREKLTSSTLLFLGYDIDNLDCRVLFRGIVAQLRDLIQNRVAVLQIQPAEVSASRLEELRSFMAKCCDKLHIQAIWLPARDFLVKLRDQRKRH